MSTVRVVVIGGGITGMAATRRLLERLSILGRPFEVKILEAGQRLGGVIGTERQNGFTLEYGPDCFLSDKPRGVGLCRDLGLSRDLITPQPAYRRSFVAWRGKLIPTPEGFHLIAPSSLDPMLLTPLLSLAGKIRLIKEYFIRPAPPADESVASFVRRRLGSEVLARLAQPFVNSVYGADVEKLSLRAISPKLLEMEKGGSVLKALSVERAKESKDASGARYAQFVTLKDGMQSLVDQLKERISGVPVETETIVDAIAPRQDGAQTAWQIGVRGGRILEADGICAALPATALARLLQPFDRDTAALFAQILYSDSLIAHFVFPAKAIGHPMDGSGFVVPAVEKRTLSACTFVHRKFAGRAPDGYALLRAFVSGAAAAALRSTPAPDIERRLLSDLSAYLKISGKPAFFNVYRHLQAMPQYPVGHVERLKTIEERMYQWRNLQLAGNWRRGVGVPDCIEIGEHAADALVNSLCQI